MKGAHSAVRYLGVCFVREVEVSELLRVYLQSTTGHFSPIRFPATGTLATKTAGPVAVPGKEGEVSGAGECSTKSPTKLQKQTQEISTGVFQTLGRRPSRFSRHCEYISSRRVLPLLPESLDGFQMREVGEDGGGGTVKGCKKSLAPCR